MKIASDISKQPKQNIKIVFYFIRHGQTDWNREDRIQGQTDIPLNDTGIAQANKFKVKLADIVFERCYSSDLMRASETAQIIMQGQTTKIVLDKRLRERNFRKLEGQPSPAYIYASQQDLNNIESDEALTKRIFQFLDEIIHTYANCNILVVAHGGIIRSVLTKILSLTCRDVNIDIGNLGTMKLIFENGKWHLEEILDIHWP